MGEQATYVKIYDIAYREVQINVCVGGVVFKIELKILPLCNSASLGSVLMSLKTHFLVSLGPAAITGFHHRTVGWPGASSALGPRRLREPPPPPQFRRRRSQGRWGP